MFIVFSRYYFTSKSNEYVVTYAVDGWWRQFRSTDVLITERLKDNDLDSNGQKQTAQRNKSYIIA